jgi:hypothetical protein
MFWFPLMDRTPYSARLSRGSNKLLGSGGRRFVIVALARTTTQIGAPGRLSGLPQPTLVKIKNEKDNFDLTSIAAVPG